MPIHPKRAVTRRRLLIALLVFAIALLLLSVPKTAGNAQAQTKPTGVLRIRVRVKIGETTKGLQRKRFYLLKGTLDQNKAVLDAAKQKTLVGRDCFYSRLGASQALIDWLKAADCESVYCRNIESEFITGPKAVPEFATAYAAGVKEFGADVARKWLTTNLPTQLRDGFYQEQRNTLQALMKQAEVTTGSTVSSVMTDRNGTAYFTDLETGTYVLTNLLATEIAGNATTWNCEVQIKSGDIATEKPYMVSNSKDRNVKCVGVEKPLPVCSK